MLFRISLMDEFKRQLIEESRKIEYAKEMVEESVIHVNINIATNNYKSISKQYVVGDFKSVILTIEGLSKIESESEKFIANIANVRIG